MNQRNRGSALSDEVRAALQGEQPTPRAGQANSGNHGVSVAGSGNHIVYYGAGPGGPGAPPATSRGVWKQVWFALSIPFFLMGLWLQADFALWHQAAGDPVPIRLVAAFSGRTVQDLLVPMIGGVILGGALTLLLKALWNRL